MKNKFIAVLALTIIVGAFFLPTTALAGGGDMGKPGEVTSQPEPEPTPQPTSLPSPMPGTPWQGAPAEPEPPQDVPSSDPPVTSQPTPLPGSPWDDPPDDGNPFTPDGQGTVMDNATSDDGKEFFTFTSPEGNVFFLVIDRNRPQDNVYFLNAVTERDLMALAESSDDSPWAPVPEPLPPTPEPEPEEPPEESTPPAAAEPQTGNGTIIFAVISALVFGALAYYFKIVRPKKQVSDFDDDEDEEEEDDDYYDEEDFEDDEHK